MSSNPSLIPEDRVPNSQWIQCRIEERISAGGMVYRAIVTKLGRSVALKIIRAELLA